MVLGSNDNSKNAVAFKIFEGELSAFVPLWFYHARGINLLYFRVDDTPKQKTKKKEEKKRRVLVSD